MILHRSQKSIIVGNKDSHIRPKVLLGSVSEQSPMSPVIISRICAKMPIAINLYFEIERKTMIR